MITKSDVSYVAGIMEGEGYFGLRPKQIVVALCMTDKDVVDRVAGICGVGHRKERPLPSGKTAYIWTVTNQTHAAGLMMTLLPVMGERRSARIMECLAAWKERPLAHRLWTHCKHGHEFSGDNLRIVTEGKYNKRRCRECVRNRQRAYQERQAA